MLDNVEVKAMTSRINLKKPVKDKHAFIVFGGIVVSTLLSAGLSLGAEIQTTGVPGSPASTTTLDGKQLPPQPRKFGGVIKENAKDSKP